MEAGWTLSGYVLIFKTCLNHYLVALFPHRQADFYGIFCSAEIFATSLYQGRDLFAHLLFHLESMFGMLFRLQSRISAT